MVEGPPGAAGGLFGGHRPVPPGRAAQQWSVTFDSVGGYDANDTEGVDPGSEFVTQPSGYVSNNDLSVQYRNGTPGRFVLATGHANVNYHSEATRLVGGDGSVRLATGLGSRSGISAQLSMDYEPTFLFNSFGPVSGQPDVELPGSVSPPQGITDQRWIALQGGSSFYHNWTGRQRTDAQYVSSFREPVTGEGYDSRSLMASLQHVWNVHPSTGFELGYQFNRNQQTGASGAEPPLQSETATAGLRFQKRLSPERTYELTVGGGAIRSVVRATVSGEEATFVSPKAFGSARLDLSRNWLASLDADRSVTTLEGLTPEPFVTNALALSLTGGVGRRLRLGLVGARSVGAALISESGAFEATSGAVDARYGLARCCAVFASYSYYHYKLEQVPTLVGGVPTRYTNQGVRLGMTFWLPLYGSF